MVLYCVNGSLSHAFSWCKNKPHCTRYILWQRLSNIIFSEWSLRCSNSYRRSYTKKGLNKISGQIVMGSFVCAYYIPVFFMCAILWHWLRVKSVFLWFANNIGKEEKSWQYRIIAMMMCIFTHLLFAAQQKLTEVDVLKLGTRISPHHLRAHFLSANPSYLNGDYAR